MRERGVTVRDLGGATGYSYEYLRKVVAGTQLASRTIHERLSKILGIDADAAWREATARARARRPTARGMVGSDPEPRAT